MDKELILKMLPIIANWNLSFNLLTHILIYSIGLFFIFSQNNKIKTFLLKTMNVILPFTVSIIAFLYSNYFNGITFALLSIAMCIGMYISKDIFEKPKLDLNFIVGGIFVLIGLVYPEFVNTSGLGFLLYSPIGVIPCPTLIFLLGINNIFYDKINKFSLIFLIIYGLFYGITGVLLLNVMLDIGLILITFYVLLRLMIDKFKK